MKVTGPGTVQSNAIRRVRRGGENGGPAFADHVSGESQDGAVAAVGATAPPAPVDALIALQEVPDATSGRRRAFMRGSNMLDLLDEVRVGLLSGVVPRGRLQSLLDALKGRRESVEDPRLAQLIDEIELRASVELAKLSALP
ncbi:MAG: flagellar assembly protein FliX [Proteobacteria bacterium]|nr:flagellar assembly protein FliX [Pseudomonadota bacterium]